MKNIALSAFSESATIIISIVFITTTQLVLVASLLSVFTAAEGSTTASLSQQQQQQIDSFSVSPASFCGGGGSSATLAQDLGKTVAKLRTRRSAIRGDASSRSSSSRQLASANSNSNYATRRRQAICACDDTHTIKDGDYHDAAAATAAGCGDLPPDGRDPNAVAGNNQNRDRRNRKRRRQANCPTRQASAAEVAAVAAAAAAAAAAANQVAAQREVSSASDKKKTTIAPITRTTTTPTITTTTANASAIVEKTIETAVFIDQALDNKFAGLSGGFVELNKQVLTIMNQVQHLFKYSSLTTPINIKLKLVERLKDFEKNFGEPAPSSANGDIDTYLSNFCQWQAARLKKERSLTWDHAILLSGLDLYKTNADRKANLSAVLGLAWVGGMCKTNYSCTINEATNFESAFVIAHEVGHSLGIMHDGVRNNCDPAKFIMSDKTGPGKIHWSKCSNDYLRDAIKRHELNCLDSEASSEVDSLYDLGKLKPPGQVYSISDQCKLAFGAKFAPFVTRQKPFNDACRELWCSEKGIEANPAHPALEGSACEADKSCREGKCA